MGGVRTRRQMCRTAWRWQGQLRREPGASARAIRHAHPASSALLQAAAAAAEAEAAGMARLPAGFPPEMYQQVRGSLFE